MYVENTELNVKLSTEFMKLTLSNQRIYSNPKQIVKK